LRRWRRGHDSAIGNRFCYADSQCNERADRNVDPLSHLSRSEYTHSDAHYRDYSYANTPSQQYADRDEHSNGQPFAHVAADREQYADPNASGERHGNTHPSGHPHADDGHLQLHQHHLCRQKPHPDRRADGRQFRDFRSV